MDLILERTLLSAGCALGRLHVGNETFFTIEQPWADNLPNHSCIPPGSYQLVPHSTAAHPDTWAMVNGDLGVFHEPEDIPAGTTGRCACLIHPANWAFQLEGCVAPGLQCIDSEKGKMVTESRVAFTRIRDLLGMGSTGHTMTIFHTGSRPELVASASSNVSVKEG